MSQTVAMHILPNISRSKCNQKMKFGQFIELTREEFFFKNHAENETWRLVPDPFLFFKNALLELKTSGQQLT